MNLTALDRDKDQWHLSGDRQGWKDRHWPIVDDRPTQVANAQNVFNHAFE
jgi:hypothetical protein